MPPVMGRRGAAPILVLGYPRPCICQFGPQARRNPVTKSQEVFPDALELGGPRSGVDRKQLIERARREIQPLHIYIFG